MDELRKPIIPPIDPMLEKAMGKWGKGESLPTPLYALTNQESFATLVSAMGRMDPEHKKALSAHLKGAEQELARLYKEHKQPLREREIIGNFFSFFGSLFIYLSTLYPEKTPVEFFALVEVVVASALYMALHHEDLLKEGHIEYEGHIAQLKELERYLDTSEGA